VHPVTAPPTWPSAATTPPDDVEAAVRAAIAPPPGEPMGVHYAHCFGCGDLHPTGLHLKVTAGEGVTVTAEFTVTDHHQGAPGLAHGGLLATAFDEAMGFLLWLVGKPAVTGRLETDYLLPVPVGTTLVMHCECLGVQRRKVYVRGTGRIGSAQGPVAVRAAGLFIAVPLEHFSRHSRPGDDVPTDRSYNP
jgi:acyl-coenzyme A thioesterase PaaI-like protein